MNKIDLEKALREMSPDSLLAEIPEIQNSIAHLRRSNAELKEFIENNGFDEELSLALEENKSVIKRYEERILLTLELIRERLGEDAARAMEEIIQNDQSLPADLQNDEKQNTESQAGIFL